MTAAEIPTARLEEVERAIWRSGGWEDGCSPEERAAIVAEWERMPGDLSFYDAVTVLIRARRGPEAGGLTGPSAAA